VVAGDQLAADAGAAALRAGGTAIDAAVAAAFVLCVVKPQSCGIGGYGGFLTYAPPGEPVVQLDFNTWVPLRLENPTLREPGYVDPPSSGGAAVAPMAVVPGLLAAHKRFGRRPLAEVVEPAIRLSRDGFTIGDRLDHYLLEHWESPNGVQPEFASVYFPDGRPPRAGEILVQADLAVTLEAIAAHGTEPLRTGPIVEAVCATVKQHGGFLEPEDFIDDDALAFAPPEKTTFEDAVVYGPSLQTSGAGVVFAALRHLRPDRLGGNREQAYVDELAEALRAAWKERTAAARAAGSKSNDTTHLCAADDAGGLASLTFTHGPSFGGGLVATGTGIVLNGGVDLFASAPGGPLAITNMSPVIVERPEGIRHAVGGVGGPRIPAIIFSAIVDAVHYGSSMADAIAAPHLSVRATDGGLECEPELLARLEPGAGELLEGFGPACGITQTPDGSVPGPDPRFDTGFARA
jgi:gamma-glutamyltranspeptidase/glutathione hydrolase